MAKENKTSIDSVINAQAGLPRDRGDKHFDKHNLLVCCRYYRKQGILLQELRRIAAGADKRDAAIALRWANKLEASKRRQLTQTQGEQHVE